MLDGGVVDGSVTPGQEFGKCYAIHCWLLLLAADLGSDEEEEDGDRKNTTRARNGRFRKKARGLVVDRHVWG